MTQFSANLGFLWADRALPEAIHAAHVSGFDAVEFHWPYATPAADLRKILKETGLPAMGINSPRGNVEAGDNGLTAVPGREKEARDAIRRALGYAEDLGARAVHALAGFARGNDARRTYVENLGWAADLARKSSVTLLIEPLNRHDAPGYFLETTDQARSIIEEVSAPNLKIMFDCYHVGRTEGDLITRLRDLRGMIGHIQFASVPDRGRPDRGELNYSAVFEAIAAMGWDAPLGAEYRPVGDTDATLGWMNELR